ncbi:MAG TPA: rod shape-determining protein MreC [Gemmatimonadaceae bacterium]
MHPAARIYGRRDTIFLIACIVLSLVALGLPDRMRDPLAASLRRSVLAPLVSLQRNAELSRRAWVTREARAAARDSVALRSMALNAVDAENRRLRLLLGLGARLKWGFIPAEVLQGRGVGEEYSVTLSAGARAGVQPFSPVVAPEGLVGMVKTVDPTMSIAIVWAHPDFRVSAMAADGSAFGIVAAHLGSEPERYLLEMRGVPVRSTLKPGTLIVSSGLGSTFPRGIPVGTVLGEIKTSELWARTYLLRPAVMPAEMNSVMVLTPRRSTSGVEGVWQTGRGLDSAARAVVAAGDSLQRADAERRAAAADSVRRDGARRDSVRAAAARPQGAPPATPDTSAPVRP